MKSQPVQRGQAHAEYMPVLTVVGLIAVLILWPLGDLIGAFIGKAAGTLVGPASQSEPIPRDADQTGDDDPTCFDFEPSRGGSQCDQSEHCSTLAGQNPGVYVDPGGEIEALVISAGQDYLTHAPGRANDGCYDVIIEGASVSCQKIVRAPECQDASHFQSWQAPFWGE